MPFFVIAERKLQEDRTSFVWALTRASQYLLITGASDKNASESFYSHLSASPRRSSHRIPSSPRWKPENEVLLVSQGSSPQWPIPNPFENCRPIFHPAYIVFRKIYPNSEMQNILQSPTCERTFCRYQNSHLWIPNGSTSKTKTVIARCDLFLEKDSGELVILDWKTDDPPHGADLYNFAYEKGFVRQLRTTKQIACRMKPGSKVTWVDLVGNEFDKPINVVKKNRRNHCGYCLTCHPDPEGSQTKLMWLVCDPSTRFRMTGTRTYLVLAEIPSSRLRTSSVRFSTETN